MTDAEYKAEFMEYLKTGKASGGLAAENGLAPSQQAPLLRQVAEMVAACGLMTYCMIMHQASRTEEALQDVLRSIRDARVLIDALPPDTQERLVAVADWIEEQSVG